MAFLPEIPGARPAGRPTVADRLPGFLRVLREDGFSPGIAETIDASRVLAAVPVDDIGALREGWKALVSGEAGHWRRFDRLFDAYWLGKGGKRSGTAVRSSGRGRGAIGRPGLPDMLRRAAEGGEADGGGQGHLLEDRRTQRRAARARDVRALDPGRRRGPGRPGSASFDTRARPDVLMHSGEARTPRSYA